MRANRDCPPLRTHKQLLERDCGPKLRLNRIQTSATVAIALPLRASWTVPAPATRRVLPLRRSLSRSTSADHIGVMCGRVIQSSAPIRYAIVDGMNVRDSRVHNYPPRWNGAPSQDLLVIRRNHKTGEVSLDPLRWGLIPYWCEDPKGGRKPINAKCETVHSLPTFRDAYQRRATRRASARDRQACAINTARVMPLPARLSPPECLE